jgi:predicted HD phosphohydrolase
VSRVRQRWNFRYVLRRDRFIEETGDDLNRQGGKFDAPEVKAAQADPLLEAKLAFRKWDDQAKVSNMQTPPLSEYEEMAVRSLLRKIIRD